MKLLFFSPSFFSLRSWILAALLALVGSAQAQLVRIDPTQAITGVLAGGKTITITVTLTNSGSSTQPDNSGHEFAETLPASMTLVSASCPTGTVVSTPPGDEDGGQVTWDGSVPHGGSVIITILAKINSNAAGQFISLQGVASFDSDLDTVNESAFPTDDPATAAVSDANSFTVQSIVIYAEQTVSGAFTPSGQAVYSVVLTNRGSGDQLDNPGNELFETLPAGLHLVSASATAGTATANAGTGDVTWNGGIAAGGSVTITIIATIDPATPFDTVFSAQGEVKYDYDVSGDSNEANTFTYAPPLLDNYDPTEFTVRDFSDAAYVAGKKLGNIDVLANDKVPGVIFTITAVTNGQHGTVTINDDGTVRYTPTDALAGGLIDSFTYTVSDGHGGTYTQTVTVRDFADAAAAFTGLLQPPVDGGPSLDNQGLVRLKVSKTGSFTGTLQLTGAKFTLTGSFDSLGVARFGSKHTTSLILKRKGPTAKSAPPELLLAMQLPSTMGLDQLAGTISQEDLPFAAFAPAKIFYTAKNPVTSPAPGKYTVLFPPKTAPNQTLDAAHYPQGSGFGLLTISVAGAVKLSGTLADGSKISYGNSLTGATDWPLFVTLYKNKGSISGPVSFVANGGAKTDFSGLSLRWYRPMDALPPLYADGWPSGILASLIGSTFTPQARGSMVSILPGLSAVGMAGNAKFALVSSDLPVGGRIDLSANVDGRNKVTFISAPPELKLKLSIMSSGLITGSFVPPGGKKSSAIKGVVFQKQSRAAGFFPGATGVGEFDLAPK